NASPGSTITYTIVAKNNGTLGLGGISVSDVMPTQLSNVTWTAAFSPGSSGTTSGSGDISQTVTLQAGGQVTYTVHARIDVSATGTLSNTATVAPPAGVTESTPADNSATDVDNLEPQADLSVTNTDGVTAVSEGQLVSYTIVVSNEGLSTATGAKLTDTFPAGLSNVSWTSAASGGATGNTGTTTPVMGDVNETLTLPPGSSVTYTVTATVLATTTSGPFTITNTATVTPPSGFNDSNSGNNSATDVDQILPTVTLKVTDAAAAETSPNFPANPAVFLLTRTGNL